MSSILQDGKKNVWKWVNLIENYKHCNVRMIFCNEILCKQFHISEFMRTVNDEWIIGVKITVHSDRQNKFTFFKNVRKQSSTWQNRSCTYYRTGLYIHDTAYNHIHMTNLDPHAHDRTENYLEKKTRQELWNRAMQNRTKTRQNHQPMFSLSCAAAWLHAHKTKSSCFTQPVRIKTATIVFQFPNV